MTPLSDIVGSKSRAELFRLLFGQPEQELYLRELQRRSGLSVRPIQQEIARLISGGLLLSRKDGNRTYFRANSQHPLFAEIKSMVEKTTGWSAILKEALDRPEIRIAFVFGSMAADQARPDSDLDLMVIGKLGLRKLAPELRRLATRIGRELNAQVMEPAEWSRRIQAGDHFLRQVMSGPKKFVIGNENDLKRLG
jgi:predicted nucleotidyltransferase